MANITDLTNALGGLTGLLSACFVVYEKVSSKPKIISKVSNIELRLAEPSPPYESNFVYNFSFDLQIGNVGSQLTTILSSELIIENNNWKFECLFIEGLTPMSERKKNLILAPGFAGTYSFFFQGRSSNKLDIDKFNGLLKHHLINGKSIKNQLIFEVRK